ncbi:MAG: hypothetical protein HOO02_05170, partial [Rhodospirillaceae bacterium]|nr:hypothetical protein [Rhodospirillaceae bacterium]
GEDADKDTVPRNSRVYKRVLDALVNEMNDEGFNVYDETAVTLDDFAQGRVRRTDAEIIDIARSVKRPPIDVAVIYSIYASANKLSYTTKIQTRITGRLLNVRSGKRLGNFEVELPQADNAPVKCERECILETVGKNARVLGMDLGVVLTKKLDWLAARSDDKHDKDGHDDDGLASAYSLVFTGFTPDDITSIEEYIVAFRGYEHHRPVSSSLRNAEYWYETKSKSARLNRNLRLMMEHLGYEGRVTFKGSSFQIDKISKRKNR